MSPTPFEAAVAVTGAGRGRYRAAVEPSWSGPVAPNGGMLAATIVRAVETELGDGAPPPRTVAAHFLDVPPPGPVEIVVETLRRGKRVAACDARMFAGDRLVCHAAVIASAARAEHVPLRREPPVAPPPASVPPVSMADVPGAPAMLERMELRPAFGPPIFSGDPLTDAGDPLTDATTGGWMAIGDDPHPLDAARLCALCDLWWPPLYGRLNSPAALPTLQLTVHLRDTSARIDPPVLARFTTTTVDEGHLEESGELWSVDGRLLAESTQLALLVLS